MRRIRRPTFVSPTWLAAPHVPGVASPAMAPRSSAKQLPSSDSRHRRGPTLVATGPRAMRRREAAQPHARGPGCASVGAGAGGLCGSARPRGNVRSTRRVCSHFRGMDVAFSAPMTVADKASAGRGRRSEMKSPLGAVQAVGQDLFRLFLRFRAMPAARSTDSLDSRDSCTKVSPVHRRTRSTRLLW